MKDPATPTPRPPRVSSPTLEALAARVAAIEAHLGLDAAGAPLAPSQVPDAPEAVAETVTETVAGAEGPLMPALGLSFLMLAGAFLLRAVTEAGLLAPVAGVALGLTYVLLLLRLTDRDARRARRTQATLFGAATVLVAYPFVWETTTKLDLLSAAGAAGATVLITALALGIALRHRLAALAWFALLAAVTLCTALYWATGAPLLFLTVLVALGVATVWLGYLHDWQGPQWLVAAAVNVLVFFTAVLAARPDAPAAARFEIDRNGALLIALVLPAAYLVSFSWRTLVRRREAGIFEILQSAGGILAGYAGAIRLLRTDGRGTAALGWATLVAAVAGYVAAFALVRSRQGRGLNFFFHAWLGLVLTLVGSALVVPGPWLPYLWAGLGLAAAIAGGIFDRWTLRLHCAAYLIGAAVAAGLAARILAAFVARRAPAWDDVHAAGLAVWIAALACYGLLAAVRRRRETAGWRRVPGFLVAVLAVIGAGVVAVTALAAWSTGAVSGPEAAVVAVDRTAVLAASAVLLAALGRRPRMRELSWLVDPLLLLLGLKLLLEDLRRGTPVSLFLGFAVFGVALIAAPRLRQPRAAAPTGVAAGPAVDPAPEPDPAPPAGEPGATLEGSHGT